MTDHITVLPVVPGETASPLGTGLNCYATLDALKDRLGITGTASDAELMDTLAAACRQIDDFCHRHFYSTTGAKYYTARAAGELLTADLLALTEAVADADDDGTYETTLAADTDYYLWPDNTFPKMGIVILSRSGSMLPTTQRGIRLTGTWGYGDGASATPWVAAGVTVTVDASATTATASLAGVIAAGHTILVGTEQMFVESVSSTSLAVKRGVNGTVAAAHVAGASSLAQYPAPVRRMALWLAASTWKERGGEGMISERIGDYSYTRATGGGGTATGGIEETLLRTLGAYRRIGA